MIGQPVTYTDFNDQKVTETFWFHLSKPELIEMEVEVEGGLANMIERISKSMSGRELITEFKKIILRAYGQKTPDGKRFIKNESDREAFSQTAAYHQLFMDLATSAEKAASFLIGCLPEDMKGNTQEKLNELNASAPPA